MQDIVDTLIRHGHLIVFAWVFVAQAGLPLPAEPLLLAAGALAAGGDLHFGVLVLLTVVASLLGDALWFWLGRHRGQRVLGLLCRLSLEPESCVRRTEAMFGRRRAMLLVFGKFVPGISTVAPPLAGMFGVSTTRFLVLDSLGSLAWALAFLVPGYLLGDELERLLANAAAAGTWLAAFAALVVLVLVARIVRYRLFVRSLRTARIEPAELRVLLAGDATPFLVDLRHREAIAADPHLIPGALHIAAEELEHGHAAIPRDREIVLYCT